MLKESISTKKIKWIYTTPDWSTNRVVVLIPQYNECSKGNFIQRLSHFNDFAELYDSILDVIIIDDGSKDNSLQVIERFISDNHVFFNVVAVSQNMNKIGALYLTVLNIKYSYVLFSDFDTDLTRLENLPKTLDVLDKDPSLMGCYFRMLPVQESSLLIKYQEFEYAIHRKWYEFTSTEGSVAVMPGAGSLYKKKILEKILGRHSGLRNGEDRETTAIGLNLGYITFYEKKILCHTRTPRSLKALISQRVRWNLGYIETISKEKNYFLAKTKCFSIIGMRTFLDMLAVIILLSFPFVVAILLTTDLKIGFFFLLTAYLCKLLWVYFISIVGKSEIETEKTGYIILFLFPIFKLIIEFPSWSIATYKYFIRNYNAV